MLYRSILKAIHCSWCLKSQQERYGANDECRQNQWLDSTLCTLQNWNSMNHLEREELRSRLLFNHKSDENKRDDLSEDWESCSLTNLIKESREGNRCKKLLIKSSVGLCQGMHEQIDSWGVGRQLVNFLVVANHCDWEASEYFLSFERVTSCL